MTDVTINGTAGNDVLPVPGFPDLGGLGLLIRGLGGNDLIQGQSGDDSIQGGAGADTLLAGEGNDSYDGQGGTDTYDATNLFTTFGFGGQFVFGFGGVINKGNLGTDIIGAFQVDAFGNIISVNPIETIIAPNPLFSNDNLIDLSPQIPGQSEAAFANVDLQSQTITLFSADTNAQLFSVTARNFDDIVGTRFKDTLFGDGQANEIDGRGGNDNIRGRGGNDELIGGDGRDTLRGDAGNDTLSGGNDNDRLDGGAGNDSALGGAGNDTFVASTGNDIFIGNTGIDVYDASNLIASQGPLGGVFEFGFGGRITKGSIGNDLIGQFTGASAEPVEVVIAPTGASDNLVDLSADPDQVGVASSIVNLGTETIQLFLGDLANNVSLFSVTAQNFDDIIGTNFGDRLTGNSEDNIVRGGAGDDTFFGSLGNDAFDGQDGGNDIADYSTLGAAITFRQAGIVLKGVDGLFDTTGDLGQDQLGIDDPFNFVERVIGAEGFENNLNNAGGSNISVFVDLQQERIVATVEIDIIGIPGVIDSIPAGASFEVAVENFVNIVGTDNFGDTLRGDANANDIFGGGGNDTLVGRAGNDLLSGDAGVDSLNGGGNNDTLIGGAGHDLLTTGGGADTVVLSDPTSKDTVTDFNVNQDDLLVQIAGVEDLAFSNVGANLKVSAVGGASNGAYLALLEGLAGQGANIDFTIDPLV